MNGVGSSRGQIESLSVVVPVYNAARTLPTLLDRLSNSLAKLPMPFEVICVNDGSTDDSWTVLGVEALRREWLTTIDLSRNFGQHNALLCGIRSAQHEVVVTLDDDLQNPPEEITKLLDVLATGCDVVYGSPEREQHGLWRDLASQITKLVLSQVLGAETARHVSGFRAFRTDLRGAFEQYDGPSVNLDVLLTWATTQFKVITVHHDPRQAGLSNYTFRKLVSHALNMLTGFSTVLLQVASILGFVLTLFGVVLFAYVMLRYLLQGVAVPGFTFLATIIVLFSGAELFTLGVIGEYLTRMHVRFMHQPSYLVRRRVGGPKRDAL